MSLIFVFICSAKFRKSRCNNCGGIIKAEYKKKDTKDYEWVTTFMPTAASEAYSAEPAKNITATSRIEYYITRALKVSVGLLSFALGVNIPDILDIKGDLPEIAGYALMALGLYMFVDGLSSAFKKNKNS